MSFPVIALQLLLPLALLLWLLVSPAQGRLGYAVHVTCTAIALLTLKAASIWSLPPWWTPWFYLLLLLSIVTRQIAARRIRLRPSWPCTAWGRAGLVLLGTTSLYAGSLAHEAWLGQSVPGTDVVDVGSPFAEGQYLVANGGASLVVNAHLRTLAPDVPRYSAWRGQSYALDFVRVDRLGRHTKGWPSDDPADYLCFGSRVVAPCDGVVALARDGVPDMPVPQMDREHMLGNYVALDCGPFALVLAHLREGSVRVRPGQRVRVGETLGEVGNSGNSAEPHLHLHAQRSLPQGEPIAGEPLWLTINGRFLVRNDRLRAGN